MMKLQQDEVAAVLAAPAATLISSGVTIEEINAAVKLAVQQVPVANLNLPPQIQQDLAGANLHTLGDLVALDSVEIMEALAYDNEKTITLFSAMANIGTPIASWLILSDGLSDTRRYDFRTGIVTRM